MVLVEEFAVPSMINQQVVGEETTTRNYST
jgi:hypothetical protein